MIEPVIRATLGEGATGYEYTCAGVSRTGRVLGGTIVAPHASDLILPLSVAVHAGLSVSQLAQAFSIYPSLGGSIQEAARRLMGR